MVIDGLGWSDMIPLAKISRRLAYKKAGRKIRNMQDRVKSLLQDKAGGGSWGIHGMIDPEKRNIP